MRTLIYIVAVCLAVPALALLYFMSDNPFEFAVPGCGEPDIAGWYDVVRLGCVDPGYAFGFIGLYGGMLFLFFAAVWGAIRLGAGRG